MQPCRYTDAHPHKLVHPQIQAVPRTPLSVRVMHLRFRRFYSRPFLSRAMHHPVAMGCPTTLPQTSGRALSLVAPSVSIGCSFTVLRCDRCFLLQFDWWLTVPLRWFATSKASVSARCSADCKTLLPLIRRCKRVVGSRRYRSLPPDPAAHQTLEHPPL